MRYFPVAAPPPFAQIQMSELPAMRNEAQAIARLQNIFPSVEKAHLHAVLRSWGVGVRAEASFPEEEDSRKGFPLVC